MVVDKETPDTKNQKATFCFEKSDTRDEVGVGLVGAVDESVLLDGWRGERL